MVTWRQSYAVPPETARRLVDVILPELRARTQEFVDLPEDESIEIRMVQDQPWSGYNWYLGNGRSRVDLNTDLPIYAYRLTDLLAHEGYPGHHTEHALKERLYTEHGLGEHALQLINTPECLISEGIATVAEKMLFTPRGAGPLSPRARLPGCRDQRRSRARSRHRRRAAHPALGSGQRGALAP